MEVVGAIASSLQIVGQCGQITMTIIKWVESVRTVDERINAFVHEVSTLRATYESLRISLEQPSMLEAARTTNRDVGGHLWSQMASTLRDCERTVTLIVNVLRRIQAGSSHFKSVVKQLKEQLTTGELSRLREEIVMYNSSLQLPIQMINLTLQLRQYESTTAHQIQLDDQLTSLRQSIERVERISRGLQYRPPPRQSSFATTLVGDSEADKTWFNNMEQFVDSAKRYLGTASIKASTIAATSIRQRDDDSPLAIDARRGSAFAPLTTQQFESISMYVDELPAGKDLDTPLTSDQQSMFAAEQDQEASDDDDDDIDFIILQELLQNGHAAVDKSDYAVAEDNYRSALSVSQKQDFGQRVACSTADISLLLGECLARLEKYDEAITLLQPLASQRPNRTSSSSGAISIRNQATDRTQALSASHLLGEVYMKKSDLVNAEAYATQAHKGRKQLLGDSNPRTLESVQLVIDMYNAKNQNAMAEAYKKFLTPKQPVQEVRQLSPAISNSSSPPPQEPMSPPMAMSPTRSRKPLGLLGGLIKRSERMEAPPTSMPMNRGNNLSGGSPFLLTEEFNQLSTSPHDTSSLHIGSDTRPVGRAVRKPSSTSNGSFANIHRTSTGDITADPYVANQRKLSQQRTQSTAGLTRAPTIYSGLSREELEQLFLEVVTLSKNGKDGKAADKGLKLLQKYDPQSAILNHREPELEKNIKKSKGMGLSGSGQGYSALHFFCSLKFEPLTEVEILLDHGANPQAIACKAGWPKTDPYTPLSAAVSRGHTNLVRLLLNHGATWNPEAIKAGHKFSMDPDNVHPLLLACLKGHADIVEALLDAGIALPNGILETLPWHGNSLLHEASFRSDVAMVKMLMVYESQNPGRYTFVGHPGQQDAFGVTPIMYAVDMRDCADPNLRARKLRDRVECLRTLLQDNSVGILNEEHDEVLVERPRANSAGRLATYLHLTDKRGNSVAWYADESRGGDAALRAFLDEQIQNSRLIEF